MRFFIIKFCLFVYIMKETTFMIPMFRSDKAVYNLFNDRSPIALDISSYTGNMNLDEIEYFSGKFN